MVRFTLWAAAAFAGQALGAALEGRDFIETDLNSYEVREEKWPYGPFKTEGRDIVNSRGEKITWAGVNWPLSGTWTRLTYRIPSLTHNRRDHGPRRPRKAICVSNS